MVITVTSSCYEIITASKMNTEKAMCFKSSSLQYQQAHAKCHDSLTN